jgi:hypothetical protein
MKGPVDKARAITGGDYQGFIGSAGDDGLLNLRELRAYAVSVGIRCGEILVLPVSLNRPNSLEAYYRVLIHSCTTGCRSVI